MIYGALRDEFGGILVTLFGGLMEEVGASADSTSPCRGGAGGGCKIGTRSFPSRAICLGVAACVTTLSSR
jgi:hypothetical protein